jgi:hypothetical protein
MRRYVGEHETRKKEYKMLWLIVGVVLLVIAIAGGTIIHPILFVLGILALVAFLAHWRGAGTSGRGIR